MLKLMNASAGGWLPKDPSLRKGYPQAYVGPFLSQLCCSCKLEIVHPVSHITCSYILSGD